MLQCATYVVYHSGHALVTNSETALSAPCSCCIALNGLSGSACIACICWPICQHALATEHTFAALQFWRFIPDEAVLHRASQFGRVIGFKRMHEDMCYLDFASEEEGVAALGGLDGYRVCSNPEYRLKVVYKVC